MTEAAPDLTIGDLAKLTGRHPETLRRLARFGELPGAYRVGGRWLVSRPVVDRMRQIGNGGRQ